jgi:hypothetical protein
LSGIVFSHGKSLTRIFFRLQDNVGYPTHLLISSASCASKVKSDSFDSAAKIETQAPERFPASDESSHGNVCSVLNEKNGSWGFSFSDGGAVFSPGRNNFFNGVATGLKLATSNLSVCLTYEIVDFKPKITSVGFSSPKSPMSDAEPKAQEINRIFGMLPLAIGPRSRVLDIMLIKNCSAGSPISSVSIDRKENFLKECLKIKTNSELSRIAEGFNADKDYPQVSREKDNALFDKVLNAIGL